MRKSGRRRLSGSEVGLRAKRLWFLGEVTDRASHPRPEEKWRSRKP